jgi:membrane protein CcdC involved in cytochrome C biogenesis
MPKPSTSTKTVRFSGKPGYLLLIIAATIYFSELVIMISFKYMPSPANFKKDVLDATVLTTIFFPVLYLFVFRH